MLYISFILWKKYLALTNGKSWNSFFKTMTLFILSTSLSYCLFVIVSKAFFSLFSLLFNLYTFSCHLSNVSLNKLLLCFSFVLGNNFVKTSYITVFFWLSLTLSINDLRAISLNGFLNLSNIMYIFIVIYIFYSLEEIFGSN